MNARITSLARALDFVVLVGLGLGVLFAPLTLMWAFDDGFSTDLLMSWAAAVGLWMLGHGVPLSFVVPVDLADSLALGALAREFTVDVALLGLALLTVLWGSRIGRRESTTAYLLLVWSVAVGTLAGLSFLLVTFIPAQVVVLPLVDAVVRPALFLAAGLAIASWSMLFGQSSEGATDKFLVQGTLFPDVVESGGGSGTAIIKSHHNVGGLPDDLKFHLVEPLRTLYKNQVRAIGRELGLPAAIFQCHPFPGPGLGIRIIGEVTWERLDISRPADAIVHEE